MSRRFSDLVRLEPRASTPMLLQVAASVAAVGLTLGFGLVLFALLGAPPFAVLGVFLSMPLASLVDIGDLLIKAGPLVLIALGLSVGFRAGVWNIGAEGQFILGAIGAMGTALLIGNPDTPLALPLVLAGGVLGGMAWAAIPAVLRTRFNASELLVSLMLVYVAQQLLFYLINHPWKSRFAFGWPETDALAAGLMLPVIVPGTGIRAGLIIVLAAVVIMAVLLARTTLGYRIRVAEHAPKALRFAGYSEAGAVWTALLIGGGLAGLAGAIELTSSFGKLNGDISLGYGFTAIIVAFLGRLRPIGVLFGGLLVAYAFVGADWIRISHRVDTAAAEVFQASLLFFVLACDLLTRYRVVLRLSAPATPAAPAGGGTPAGGSAAASGGAQAGGLP